MAQCSICLDELPQEAFSPDNPEGTITLACGTLESPHQYHGHHLHDWVVSNSVDGQMVSVGPAAYADELEYQQMPPTCPVCRTRFAAAMFWPHEAAMVTADQLPDDGGKRFLGVNPHYDPAMDVSDEDSGESSGEDAAESSGEDSGESSGEEQHEALIEMVEVTTQGALEAALQGDNDRIVVRAEPGTAFVVTDAPPGCRVTFYGQVHVTVSGTGVVQILEQVTATLTSGSVDAYHETTVSASGNSHVNAFGSAQVTASGQARVEATQQATIIASEEAWVQARDEATVTASGTAVVVAFDRAQVNASGSVTVDARARATVTVSDNARVKASTAVEITASGTAWVRALDRVRVTGQGGGVRIWAENLLEVNSMPGTVRQLPDDLRYAAWDDLQHAWGQV